MILQPYSLSGVVIIGAFKTTKLAQRQDIVKGWASTWARTYIVCPVLGQLSLVLLGQGLDTGLKRQQVTKKLLVLAVPAQTVRQPVQYATPSMSTGNHTQHIHVHACAAFSRFQHNDVVLCSN